MLQNETRHCRRYSISLSALVWGSDTSRSATEAIRGNLISIGTGGCAIRTVARLALERDLTLVILIEELGKLRRMRISARVVWGRNDYRIDTLYRYGLRFLEPLTDHAVLAVLREEAHSAEILGPYRPHSVNKSVA